jgi:anti-sigma B factor antagonist
MLQIEQGRIEPDIEVVHLAGDVVLGPACQQVEMLTGRLVADGRKKIVFDLAGLIHVDSTAIGIFVRCIGLVRSAGGELRLASVPPRLVEILHTTKLDRVIPVYPNPAAAAENFNVVTSP